MEKKIKEVKKKENRNVLISNIRKELRRRRSQLEESKKNKEGNKQRRKQTNKQIIKRRRIVTGNLNKYMLT